jgi:phenylpyruvate tautomerase PptA (4-oxalocrotonate tautomerase family)
VLPPEHPRLITKHPKFAFFGTAMPYLQLDVNGTYPAEKKKALAHRLCHTYADAMQADIRRISVAIREAGQGAIWRLVAGEPVPVAVLMCDIRKGRTAEVRLAAAQRLVADCVDVLGIDEQRINVEFTQHTGDEMYHPSLGGYSPEWTPEERGLAGA